jgi:hypothetical protein
LLGNDQGVTGDAAGEVAWTERLIVKKKCTSHRPTRVHEREREREHG